MKENIPQTPQFPINSSFADGVQFVWDATSIKLAETCPRKYQLIMLEHWNAKVKSVHLLFGGLYATALEHYHKHRASGVDHDFALELVVSEALRDSWKHDLDETGERIPGTGAPIDFLHNTKTRENLIRTIVWYLEEFKADTATTVLFEGKPAVEHSFCFAPEGDTAIMLSGHLDRLVEYSDQLYVMDQKTTGFTVGPYYFEQFNLDTQMSLYTLAGKILFKLPIHGVLIDAAQIAVGFSRFARGFIHKTESQLNEWYDHTMKLIEDTRKATRENDFRMNYSSCNNYGGCEFRGVCSRSPEVRKHFLAGDFEQTKIWDPLLRR